MSSPRLYSRDLSYIHDVAFGDFARRAAPGVVRILRAHGIKTGQILEIGCGSGIVTRHLIDAGYDVFGFDQSAAMIRLARARAPEADLRVASLVRVPLPSCRAALAVGEVITYVPRGVGAFFRRVHAALEEGGLFIFDFIESAARRTYSARTIEGDGWSMVARADVSASGRVLTRRLDVKRLAGRIWRRTRETHRVRIYSRREVQRALESAGFSFRTRRSYGRGPLLPGDVVVIAMKKDTKDTKDTKVLIRKI
jgi:SAM-dependent methyltransferase